MATFLRRFRHLLLAIPLATAAYGAQADQYSEGYDLAMTGDYQQAFARWMPLAVEGDARAQFNLGLMYHGGLFVDANEPVALHWYKKAAEQGMREAQEYLYMGYLEGWFGLPKNDRHARHWQERLDQQGF